MKSIALSTASADESIFYGLLTVGLIFTIVVMSIGSYFTNRIESRKAINAHKDFLKDKLPKLRQVAIKRNLPHLSKIDEVDIQFANWATKYPSMKQRVALEEIKKIKDSFQKIIHEIKSDARNHKRVPEKDGFVQTMIKLARAELADEYPRTHETSSISLMGITLPIIATNIIGGYENSSTPSTPSYESYSNTSSDCTSGSSGSPGGGCGGE